MIGDTRQHQAVDAGRPFEQLQDAGMRVVLWKGYQLRRFSKYSSNSVAVGHPTM
jgi:ATP-dependent exoDNAse (exonuclease V) alpha subunit